MRDRVKMTLRALEVIASHLAGTPGRKNVVWVTGGIPRQLNMYLTAHSIRDRGMLSDDIRRTIRAVNASNTSIYAVDARGLEVLPSSRLSYGPQDRWAGPTGGAFQQFQENREGMKDLALSTGGRAYFDRNDLDRAMGEAVDDSRVNYTIAYYQPGEPDQSWRRIQVKVKRDGVSVRHRGGYVASKAPDTGKEDLRRALASPLDATMIGLSGAVRGAGGERTALMQIDPRNVAFVPDGKGVRCRLEVVTLLRDDAGNTVGKAQMDTLDLPLSGEKLQRVQADGILFQKAVPAGGLATEVRFGVRDTTTGQVATLSLPLNGSR